MIPAIAKADTMTEDRRRKSSCASMTVALTSCRSRLISPSRASTLFRPPTYEDDGAGASPRRRARPELSGSCAPRRSPFAVVGAAHTVRTPDGRTVRARAYPWGVIEVDNSAHCDFGLLLVMLVHTHMEALRARTAPQPDVLYG